MSTPFLQYLWGIETWLYNIFSFALTSFLQYLWGIETARCKSLLIVLYHCFYSTYEELKLFLVI